MKIRLDRVREEPFRWQETQAIPVGALGRPELSGLGEVAWRGQVAAAHPGFLLRARLSYEQTLACTRCLRSIVEAVESEVELLVLVGPARPVAGEHELREDDMSVLVVEDETLDTQPLLLEQLQLNVPMRALCRPDCAGLCPICGADRNLEPCGCKEREIDPRWSALAALRRE